MPLYHHTLAGCAPAPLAHYLKALGILRLVSEQADPDARGFWKDETFHLVTSLSKDQIERFFLDTYAPTPIIAPWNGGSGFYPKDTKEGIDPIRQSVLPRFANYKRAIEAASRLVGCAAEASKNQDKEKLISSLRRVWRGPELEMLDAAIVISQDGAPRYPSLCGTGWNDGRLDFSNNFMQRLVELLLPTQKSKVASCALLTGALFNDPEKGLFLDKKIGQFLPGGAGGANATTGPDGKSMVNPWDFIFMLEGAVMFVASLTRKTAINSPLASAPFAVHPSACAYASASKDESAARGEQWMPLWDAPVTLGDLRHLLSEGKVQLGSSPASRPLDFARAVARLGVARGITAFQRFGYLERNGQANLAVPLGRWQVKPQPNQDLIDDLDRFSWLDRLQRSARDDNAPASLSAAHRRIEDAVMAVCSRGDQPPQWQTLLAALAECEEQLVRSGKFTKDKGLQPIPPLSPGWITAADDGSAEFRLAVALALQASDASGRDGIRRHFLPLDKTGTRFAKAESGLAHDPAVVCLGLDPERDLIALVQRRLIEGSKGAGTRLPLVAAYGATAPLADLAALLGGLLDLQKVTELARPLMALNRRDSALRAALAQIARPPAANAPPPLLYALFRLACLPWPLAIGSGEVPIRCDPAIIGRLASGDLPAAGDAAIRRLQASGLAPLIRHATGDNLLARRLALSLAFPISQRDATRLAQTFTKTGKTE